ncbi:MAG: hypothetical protein ABIW85_09825 [Variovorax sp.]
MVAVLDRPPRREIGVAVARSLVQRFREPSSPSAQIDVGFELIVRGST